MNETMDPEIAPDLHALIARLGREGIRLWADGEAIRYISAGGSLSPEAIELLRSRKPLVLSELRHAGCTWPAYTTSQGQRSLWYLQQLGGGVDTSYNLLVAVPVLDAIPAEAIAQALARIYERHEALRSVYAMQAGVLWQRPLLAPAPDGLVELKLLPDASAGCLQDEIEVFARQPFDLANGPVMRAALFVQPGAGAGAERRVLAICAHHIATDFASLQLMFAELAADLTGSPRTDEPVPYRNFAAEQQRAPTEARREAARSFASLLSPLPPAPSLAPPHGGPSDAPAGYATLQWRASTRQNLAVSAAASRLGMTTFGVCMGTFGVVASRLTGQQRFVIELASTLRQGAAFDNCLGNFANLCPILVDLTARSRLGESLAAIFDSTMSSLAYREVPFAMMVEELGLSGTAVRSPISPLAFSWHRDPHRAAAASAPFGDVLPCSRQLGPPGALMMTACESERGLDFKLTYDRAAVADEFAEAVRSGFDRLLDALDAPADPMVSRIPMVSEPESLLRTGLLSTPQAPGMANSVLARIAEAADRSPDAMAVIAGENSLSYRGLWSQAVSISGRLLDLGLAPGDRVAVQMHRNIGLIPAILGVMLAGGVYVPVDPDYPANRIELILAASGASILLWDGDRCPELPAGVHGWRLGEAPVEPAADAGAPPDPSRLPGDSLAYLIFTSGSTGVPKGVAIEHRSLANLADSLARRLGIGDSSRYLAISSICFDASIAEIFVPLSAGALLVLAGDRQARDPEALAALVDAHGIDTMQATPSTWKAILLRYPERRWALRAHSMGEALPVHLGRQLAAVTREVWNLYGPTEATVYVTASRFDAMRDAGLATVPIAEPLPGCALWVLDGDLQPAAPGLVGELYLSGTPLARGYWQDEAMNARAFVELPHLTCGTPRFYRTGDCARYLGEGRVEIVGRKDTQVKVRGYRIDLGEIESVIATCGGVIDVAVATIDEPATGVRIEAFVRVEEGTEIAALQAAVASHCPAYMMPSAFHRVDAFPTNPNGKLDRKALIRLRKAPATAPAPAAPRTSSATAIRLMALLEQVLERPVTDDSASIFDVGADSMLAVEYKLAIRAAMGVDLPMFEIFERPVISTLADHIDGLESAVVPGFESDLALDLALPPGERVAPELPRRLLLTGATGYLGSRILRELLQSPDVEVACLLRATDDGSAASRLREAFGRHGLELPEQAWRRVLPIAGALGLRRFGLDAASYAKLAGSVDSVVHCAALVNFSLPYASMRGNVLGTLEIARFCSEGQRKPLHFVSTYSVLDPTLPALAEHFDIPDHPFLDFGYARSKWVCERLLSRASGQGLKVRIYRPSRIVSGGAQDKLNPSDFYSLVLAGSVAAGVAPLDAGSDNFVDVNGAARRISHAALGRVEASGAVHVCGSRWTSWQDILSALGAGGVALERLPYAQWLERVSQAASRQPALRGFLEIKPFLAGHADGLRRQFLDRHPEIEVLDPGDGAQLDVQFDDALLALHLAQLRGALGMEEPTKHKEAMS
jgi:amino acid adenylation domain-containing protein/thioester reductase-like protein